MLLRSTSSVGYFAGFPTGYNALLGGLTVRGRSAVHVLSSLCLEAYQSVQLRPPRHRVTTDALLHAHFLLQPAYAIVPGLLLPLLSNAMLLLSG
ncbi:pyruvate formate lyase family protein, partial [Salmonella enterica]|uniref:pyruvate formate lyase family protein n=1 Tax=Salmonella enterica TaxID=28901 RepID=UPI00398C81E7